MIVRICCFCVHFLWYSFCVICENRVNDELVALNS